MSTIFLFEDGHVNTVDEIVNPNLMEYIVDQDEFTVETAVTHSEYLQNATFNEFSSVCSMLRISFAITNIVMVCHPFVYQLYLQQAEISKEKSCGEEVAPVEEIEDEPIQIVW